MSTEIYIVVRSKDQWWIDFEGESTGPFSSKDVATANAVALASAADRMGRRSEVRIAEPGDSKVLFRSSVRGALTRAAVLAEAH